MPLCVTRVQVRGRGGDGGPTPSDPSGTNMASAAAALRGALQVRNPAGGTVDRNPSKTKLRRCRTELGRWNCVQLFLVAHWRFGIVGGGWRHYRAHSCTACCTALQGVATLLRTGSAINTHLPTNMQFVHRLDRCAVRIGCGSGRGASRAQMQGRMRHEERGCKGAALHARHLGGRWLPKLLTNQRRKTGTVADAWPFSNHATH